MAGSTEEGSHRPVVKQNGPRPQSLHPNLHQNLLGSSTVMHLSMKVIECSISYVSLHMRVCMYPLVI